MKRTARPLTPSQQRAREALCEVVRSKLMTLGDFGHLQRIPSASDVCGAR
jgi:hypothetical protein